MIIYMVYDGPQAVITKLKTVALRFTLNAPFASQNTEHTHWPQYGYGLQDWVDRDRMELEEDELEEDEDDDNWYEEDEDNN